MLYFTYQESSREHFPRKNSGAHYTSKQQAPIPPNYRPITLKPSSTASIHRDQSDAGNGLQLPLLQLKSNFYIGFFAGLTFFHQQPMRALDLTTQEKDTTLKIKYTYI